MRIDENKNTSQKSVIPEPKKTFNTIVGSIDIFFKKDSGPK